MENKTNYIVYLKNAVNFLESKYIKLISMGCLFSALTYANIRHLKVNPITVETFSYDFAFSTCTLYSSVKAKDNISTAHRMNEKIKSQNGLQCHKH